jgi:hypothetical protein
LGKRTRSKTAWCTSGRVSITNKGEHGRFRVYRPNYEPFISFPALENSTS